MKFLGKVITLIIVCLILTWMVFLLLSVFASFYGNKKVPLVDKSCYGVYLTENPVDRFDSSFKPLCLGFAAF
jgi:hypothetical protein